MSKSKFAIISLAVFLIVTLVPVVCMAKRLTIATDPLGSATYSSTAGMAKILNDNTTYNVKVRSTTGATEIGSQLALGEVQLGILANYNAKMAYLTKGFFDKPLKSFKISPFRLLMGGPPTIVSVVVREDSGIKVAKDLKGKRFVGVFAGCEACTLQGDAFLANWGLTRDDVIMMKTPGLKGAIEHLIEAKADASGTGGTGMAILKELGAKRGARFLSLDPSPKAIKAYQKIFPAAIKLIKPAPDKAGVKEPIYMAVFEDLFIANKNLVNDEVAYNLLKAFWDHNDELRKIHDNLKDVTRKAMVTGGAPMPYHPGAIKFYKEKGVWSEVHEEKNNTFLKQEQLILKK